jgi:hypothetical protein
MPELSGYVYKCSAGETIDKVALNLYGDEKHAADLLNANPGHVHKMVFVGDEVLSIPVVETSESEYAPAPAPWKE